MSRSGETWEGLAGDRKQMGRKRWVEYIVDKQDRQRWHGAINYIVISKPYGMLKLKHLILNTNTIILLEQNFIAPMNSHALCFFISFYSSLYFSLHLSLSLPLLISLSLSIPPFVFLFISTFFSTIRKVYLKKRYLCCQKYFGSCET